MRKTRFTNNEYYHIYNRGVDKRDVFTNGKDFFRFLKGMKEFNRIDPIGSLYAKEKVRCPTPLKGVGHLTEIICYSLALNHYHFILKQIIEGSISEFMKRLGGGYTNYFNLKYDRSGSLFQGRFKSIHIDTNEYLLWLSGYVNGNDRIHSEDNRCPTPVATGVGHLTHSSYPDYLGLQNGMRGTLCNQEEMKIILDQFPNAKEYEKFVEMVIKESRKRKDVEKYLLE